MSDPKKKKRELEIAANFEKVLNHLPVDFYFAFINTIQEHNFQQEESFYENIGIYGEKNIFKDNKNRVDLYFNLSNLPSKIIFEFKLGKENINQVIGYENSTENSLIVSISSNYKMHDNKNIIQLSWNELFNGFIKIASAEIREKLIPIDTTESFSPGFPERRLGEPALSFLEDFLFTIRNEKLVPFKGERVLAVAGRMANSTTKKHNVYWFGINWDRDFEYLAVIEKNKINYVGKVKERYFDLDKLEDIPNKKDKENIKDAFLKNKDQFSSQPIVTLEKLEFPELNPFKGKGAVTQSHRYFKNLNELYKLF